MVSSGQRGFLLRLFRTLVGSTCGSNEDLQRGWGSSSLSPSGSPASEALQGSALNVSSARGLCLSHQYAQGGVGVRGRRPGGKGCTRTLRSGVARKCLGTSPLQASCGFVPATPEELDTPSPSCRKSPLLLWVALFSYAAKLRTPCLSAESELQEWVPPVIPLPSQYGVL